MHREEKERSPILIVCRVAQGVPRRDSVDPPPSHPREEAKLTHIGQLLGLTRTEDVAGDDAGAPVGGRRDGSIPSERAVMP